MESFAECIPCFLKQALEAMEMTDADEATKKRVIQEIMRYLGTADLARSPPSLSMDIHEILRNGTGNDDPYVWAKQQSTEIAQRLLPKLTERFELAVDENEQLDLAIRYGAAGNVIDFGQFTRLDLNDTVEKVMHNDLTHSDLAAFRADLERPDVRTILVLGDNTGEILLDVFLLRLLHQQSKELIFAVRSAPIINDATEDDAREAGIHQYARIIPNGNRSPGTLFDHISPELTEALAAADLIISKGQGNFETLSRNPELRNFARSGTPIYFLLTVKCPQVAAYAGYEAGSTIFSREVI